MGEASNKGAGGRGHGRELRSFGRRRGRRLGPRQQARLEHLLPRVAIDLSCPPPVTTAALFQSRDAPVAGGQPQAQETWLEIGFGGGEHLVWQAVRNPHVGMIGCEPFEDGMVKVLSEIEARGLANIRLHPDDARPLLRWLPQSSIARAFILFPDPWPKRRHQKRRLVNAALLDELARVLRPGAELRIATDIADYARTILMAFGATAAFGWIADGPGDWRTRPGDWPETRYEQKALREGRPSIYLRFVRSD
jgi:tRNA (guanine-N7-)-methyltransferase